MLSEQDIRAVVAKHFPKDAVVSRTVMKKGLINWNCHVRTASGNEMMLRVYPEDSWKAAKEEFLYAKLAVETDVPVPKVLARGTFKEKAYLLLSRIGGNHLPVGDREMVHAAGRLLASIHSVSYPSFGWIRGGHTEPAFSSWKPFLAYDADEKLKRLSRISEVSAEVVEQARQYIEKGMSGIPDDVPARLLHKDYHQSHIICNKGKIAGIIDFEWATAGHTELDLVKSLEWMFHGRPAMEQTFLTGYREKGFLAEGFERRKGCYAVILLVGLVAMSYERGSRQWFDYNLRELKAMLKGKL
ncbi:TPA: aminoglycoside phosphotransferase family protein [Candidatus Woesearchaeota archaeon]|nr:aminoglycoside phosphotransferase family protein [Candidatus Woesearchaeota archaeon]HII69078.1 aminoglycoside phosphotransferase family protein [Candidatus Woesearchaeota archaeon]